MLFTFITDREGATFAEQFDTGDLVDAVTMWMRTSTSAPRLSSQQMERFDTPTPIDGLNNVWCFSIVDDNDMLFLAHIILTAV